MRILFALPGFHRHDRGAEVALVSVAERLSTFGHHVTLIGSGEPRAGKGYHYIKVSSIDRSTFERFPFFPVLRSEYAYEELTYSLGLLRRFDPSQYDVTLTCSYPFTNWILKRSRFATKRPPHIFVTQNGDWPARSNILEYRYFGCDGLVCINPDYYEQNSREWNCRLIPNGVDLQRFSIGPADRQRFSLPTDRLVVLMVSALIPSKRVGAGIAAVSKMPNAHLVVAGDGPLRAEIDNLANALLPGRFIRLTVPPSDMPLLYRSADVFLHLSLMESFGNVFVEALATGLPIVGHDSPRLRWIVGDREHLVDTQNAEAVVDALNLAAGQPEEKRVQRRVIAERFSWDSIARQYEAFLQELHVDPKRLS